MKREKDYEIKNVNLMLQFVIIILVLYFVALITLSYLDSRIKKAQKREIVSNEKNIMYLEKKMIERDIKKILGDVHFLKDSLIYHFENNTNRKTIERTWKSFSEHSEIYDQIRFLDNDGNEKIRINYNKNKAVLVKKEELQNKKNRYYFSETVKLNQNECYISKLDLNIEHKKIEQPLKPMIRFSTRVFVNNKPMGIIVVNYLAEGILNEFNKISQNSYGNVYLLNSNSYWLTGGNEKENWAFMYNDRKNINFFKRYSMEWNKIVSGNKVVLSDKGLFLTDNIELKNVYLHNHQIKLSFDDMNFRIISFIGDESKVSYIFSERYLQKIWRLIKENKIIFLFITIISILIEGVAIIYKKTYLKIKYHADHDSLTKTYNRRAGLRMLEEYFENENRRKTKELSICFIDVNGLKQVNDILGHKYGDELILTVIKITKEIIREEDFIIRIGGDEFLLVFMGIDTKIAEVIWERILEKINEINVKEKRKYLISVSHGIVDSEMFGERIIDKIIKKADEKMYEEKKELKKNDFSVIK